MGLPEEHPGHLSGPAHDSTDLHQFYGIHGAGGHTPAATDTAAVVRAEHPATLLRDAMPPAKMGAGAASLAEGIIDNRAIGTETADTGIVGFDEQRSPFQ